LIWGACGFVKTIQGKTEFTGGIGFRGSVRSVQSGWVFVRRKKKFRSGSFFRARLAQWSLIGLGPGEKKRDFEACANKAGLVPVENRRVVVFPKGKRGEPGRTRREGLSALHVIVVKFTVSQILKLGFLSLSRKKRPLQQSRATCNLGVAST
jgi:hypothetical protein